MRPCRPSQRAKAENNDQMLNSFDIDPGSTDAPLAAGARPASRMGCLRLGWAASLSLSTRKIDSVRKGTERGEVET